MNSLRPLLLRLTGCLLVIALCCWALSGSMHIGAPAPAVGTKGALLLGGATLVPIATPLVTTLLSDPRN